MLLPAVMVFLASPLGGQSPPGWVIPAMAKLASLLSQGDAAGALESFDSGNRQFGAIQAEIDALTGQTDILCAIDVIENKEIDGLERLDVDWYMQLKSKADGGPSERRRERVALEMKQFSGKWKIVSINPIAILDPIHIK